MWGLEQVGNSTKNWVMNSQTLGTIGFLCDFSPTKKPSDYVLLVKLPLTKEVKKTYKIKSSKKSAWIIASVGVDGGSKFRMPNGRDILCPNANAVVFNWFPPAGVTSVQADWNLAINKNGKKIGSIFQQKNFENAHLSDATKYGIVVHPQFQNAIQQASIKAAGGSKTNSPSGSNVTSQQNNSSAQQNNSSAQQNNSSAQQNNSTTFTNPYNIPGVGRVLQDGSIEYGVYYGGNNQLAIDLTSGNFYQAAQNTARSASEAQQMCIASNLTSGDIASASRC